MESRLRKRRDSSLSTDDNVGKETRRLPTRNTPHSPKTNQRRLSSPASDRTWKKKKIDPPKRKPIIRERTISYSPPVVVDDEPEGEVLEEVSLAVSRMNCPISGCDGEGNLDGLSDKHCFKETCPLYHNIPTTYLKRLKSLRSTNFSTIAEISLNIPPQLTRNFETPPPSSFDSAKSPKKSSPRKSNPNKHLSRLDEERKRINEELAKSPSMRLESSSRNDADREGYLLGITTKEDLELFRLAQSALAAKVEENPLETIPIPNAKQMNWIQLGRWEMRAWYPSEYPERLARLERAFVCEYCLKCMPSVTLHQRHSAKCVWRHPPGNEIYRDGNLSFWEVDGKNAKVYCQNLCLLAKLFLDHKTLYYDVEPFLFYVLTEVDSSGCHMLGYFSKEKESIMKCNLSCLLTLPCHQRKGYGRLLIDFSYLLSRVEERIGSPEHPLTDLGLLTYRTYWKEVIMTYLMKLEERTPQEKKLCIKDISAQSGIHPNDIVSTLQYLGMIKYWRGEYIVYKSQEIYDTFVRKRTRKAVQGPILKPEKLSWRPPHWEDSSEEEDGEDMDAH